MSTAIMKLQHITTHPNYLDSNSTSHKWVFGAFAELIDNSMDAGATRLDIAVSKNKKSFVIKDDGSGMDLSTLHKMMSLGHTFETDTRIGRYGNGFKSGAMRIGRDVIVFTKDTSTLSVGLLSQTFLHDIGAQDVLLPMCSWDKKTLKIINEDEEEAQHSIEFICKYSPYSSEKEVLDVFNRIQSETGTMIGISTLSKHGNKSEFDFNTSPTDIMLKQRNDTNKVGRSSTLIEPSLKYSLRSYLEVLYLKPKMQIFLRGQRVDTKPLTSILYKARTGLYNSQSCNKPIPITYGFNIDKNTYKNYYGVFIYNKNRLIEPLIKVGFMELGDSRGTGVIGVCEVPHLQPTHNKQGFMGNKDYNGLKRALASKLKLYWEYHIKPGQIANFWKASFLKEVIPRVKQCVECLKWRKLSKLLAKDFQTTPSTFMCSLVEGLSCDTPEAKKIHLVHFQTKLIDKSKEEDKEKKDVLLKSTDVISESGEQWVGRRAKAWWNLDKKGKWFYGVISVYDSHKDLYKLTYDDGAPQVEAWHNYQDFVVVKNEYGGEQIDDSVTLMSTRSTRRINRDEKRNHWQQLKLIKEEEAVQRKRKPQDQLQNSTKKQKTSTTKKKTSRRHRSKTESEDTDDHPYTEKNQSDQSTKSYQQNDTTTSPKKNKNKNKNTKNNKNNKNNNKNGKNNKKNMEIYNEDYNMDNNDKNEEYMSEHALDDDRGWEETGEGRSMERNHNTSVRNTIMTAEVVDDEVFKEETLEDPEASIALAAVASPTVLPSTSSIQLSAVAPTNVTPATSTPTVVPTKPIGPRHTLALKTLRPRLRPPVTVTTTTEATMAMAVDMVGVSGTPFATAVPSGGTPFATTVGESPTSTEHTLATAVNASVPTGNTTFVTSVDPTTSTGGPTFATGPVPFNQTVDPLKPPVGGTFRMNMNEPYFPVDYYPMEGTPFYASTVNPVLPVIPEGTEESTPPPPGLVQPLRTKMTWLLQLLEPIETSADFGQYDRREDIITLMDQVSKGFQELLNT